MINYEYLINDCIHTCEKIIFNLKNNNYLDDKIISLIVKLKNDHRYCPASNELDNLLLESCELMEERIVTKILGEEKLKNLLTFILIIFNSCSWFHKSKFYFIKNNIQTPNHSFYKQAFAESALGCGGHFINDQCGVQFYSIEQLYEIKKLNRNMFNFFYYEQIYKSLNIPKEIDNIFLISVDVNYLEKFGIAQAVSIIENYSPKNNSILFTIHLAHSYESQIFNKFFKFAEKKHWKIFVIYYDYPNNAILTENIKNDKNNRRTYLACVRFLILHDLIFSTKKTITLTDADQFFQSKLEDNNKINCSDLSLIDHAQFFPRTSLYSKYGASYVEFNNNLNSLAYTSLLSDFLKLNLIINPNWTLDQFALLYVSMLYPNIIINKISPHNIYNEENGSLFNMAGPEKYTDEKFISRKTYLLNLMMNT